MNLLLVAVVLLTTSKSVLFAQWNPNFSQNRSTMVHLFEWKWNDISEECVRFLGPNGYAGVQTSPPNENAIIRGAVNRPWWERYQPVSYKLETRSGTEEEFKNMVKSCNEVGVRIYPDVVINHMTGQGSGKGTGGSNYDTANQSYEAVPYSRVDFNGFLNCPTRTGDIVDYSNAIQVRNCKLSGLNDLNQGRPSVREKITEYINKLIGYGVAGIRIDASKHMWVEDLKLIIDGLDDLSTDHGFPAYTRPLIFQEVIDLGSEPITATQYVGNGRVTEFKYGKFMGEVFRKQNNQKLAYLKNYGEGWAFLKSADALAFIDNHDNQRGHGAGGESILTFREPRLYKQAVAFMLSWPYGVTRVMSSYYWERNMQNGKDNNDWIGPPQDENESILDVGINSNEQCDNGWVCEHRWKEIKGMVAFRNIVLGTKVEKWWDNGANQIAFSRGNKGFIAINNDDFDLISSIPTSLKPGEYCDIISGTLENGLCKGNVVFVNSDGKANITILKSSESPIVAIHFMAKLE